MQPTSQQHLSHQSRPELLGEAVGGLRAIEVIPVPPRNALVSTGDRKGNVETPAICLDLTRFESNLIRVSDQIRLAGKVWRPQSDDHHCAEIALQQIRTGAVGLTCATLSEAEYFASIGIRDLLIAQAPVGVRGSERIARLGRIADPIVACDHYVQAKSLSTECARQGVTCRVLVEINLGTERTGVRPGRDAIELARGIQGLGHLKLCGIMGHASHAEFDRDVPPDASQIGAALGILSHAQHVFKKNSLNCDIVSVGGDGSLQQALACAAVTEIQAGSIIFGNDFLAGVSETERLVSPLTLLTTVISRPAFERAVMDAGRKSCWISSRTPRFRDGMDARVLQVNSDHLVACLGSASAEWRIGDQVELEIESPQLTTLLHNEFFCFRHDRLEAIWPIHRRGKLV